MGIAHKDTSARREEKQAYDQLVKACFSIDSGQDEKKLFSLKADFLKASQNLHKQVEAFKESLAKAPVSFLVLLWGELLSNDKMFGKRYLGMLRDLVDAELLTLVSNKKKTETLQDLSLQDPSIVVDRIRCYKDWSIHKREDYVFLYKAFSEWMSKETFGYIPEAKDLDRIATHKRLIPFETYTEIISRMDLREQILAKIFYLGGPRALEDVLSLKIEDIDFDRFVIHFPEDISYPRHLFEDIKRYLEGRKKGFAFMGRDGERISTTTPFRALKKVTSELNLDPEFTFKEFTKNI